MSRNALLWRSLTAILSLYNYKATLAQSWLKGSDPNPDFPCCFRRFHRTTGDGSDVWIPSGSTSPLRERSGFPHWSCMFNTYLLRLFMDIYKGPWDPWERSATEVKCMWQLSGYLSMQLWYLQALGCAYVCVYTYLCILRMLAWINTFVLVSAFILVAVSIYFCYNNRALCYGGKLFLTPVWILSTHHPILPLGFSSCLSKRSSYSTSIPSHLLEKDAVSPWCSLSELGVAWEPCWFGQTNTHWWQTLMKTCLGNSTVPVISQQGVAEQMEDPLLRYLRAVGL